MISPQMRSRALILGTAIVAGVYLLQMVSPLRLHTDAINYLLMAADIADGGDFKRIGPYPLGYPTLLAGLDLLGLGAPWAFVLCNCLFIGIGLAAGYALCRTTFGFAPWLALLVCLLTLLSFVLIKYMAIPLSDMPFLGVSMVALLLISRLPHQVRRSWTYVLTFTGIILLIAAAVSLRVIGVALLPALLWALAGQRVRTFWTRTAQPASAGHAAPRRPWKRPLVLTAAITIGIAAVGAIITQTPYYAQVLALYRSWGAGNVVTYTLTHTFGELGAIALNVPWMPQPLQWVQVTLGVGWLGLIGAGIWTRRSTFSAVEMYLIPYVVLLFAFPSPTTGRYWLPILPLLFAFLILAFRHILRVAATARRFRGLEKVVAGYLVCFMLIGLGGLGYTSRITFAGHAFPQRYGSRALAPTYELVLNGGPASDQVDPRALRVLQRYETRLHHRARTVEP